LYRLLDKIWTAGRSRQEADSLGSIDMLNSLSDANSEARLLVAFIFSQTSGVHGDNYESDTFAAPPLRQLVPGFPPRRPASEPGSGHERFVVDKVALGEVFSEYLRFLCRYSFHQELHNHHHFSSGAGATGQ
jgi:hypothetical protein